MDFALSVISGFIGSVATLILAAILIERPRLPYLVFAIEPPYRPDFGPARQHTRVIVSNMPMTGLFSWLYQRQTAYACSDKVRFVYSDAVTPVHSEAMLGRWADLPEPFAQVYGPDPDNPGQSIPTGIIPQNVGSVIDIPSGSAGTLDIAVRSDGELEAYGWNTEGYAYRFHNPKLHIRPGQYYVDIEVKTGGQVFRKRFSMINDVEFRLEPVQTPRRFHVFRR